MIILTLSTILFVIFTLLGGLHFYWLFGGIWALEKAIPTKGNKATTLAIPQFATLIVGLGLISFGMIYLLKTGIIRFNNPVPKPIEVITFYGSWIIPFIFILRAIGEFNYVGFFKKIKNTEFAKADSKLFSPLCAGIGIAGLVIQLIS